MSHLPYEGYSYYIDSENFYHFNVVVPYSPYNYRVEVLSPVLPIIEEEIVLPDVTLEDFKKWVRSADELIGEDKMLYPLFELLIEVARQVIAYEMCGSDDTFKRAVSYYVAHYLELHVKLIKDEENKMSLTPEKESKETSEEKTKKMELVDSTYGNYRQTIWGQMYWTIYGQNAKFVIGYVPL